MYYQTRSAAWLAPRLSCGDVFDNPIYPFFYHDYCITYAEHYKIEAILDKSQRKEKYTSATFLANSGIPTYIDDKHAIAHNKIIIVDRTTVITGSFNFTKAAEEKNAENLLIITSADMAKPYLENWMEHKEHSEVYQGRQ